MSIAGSMPLIGESVLFFVYTMAELALLFVGISFLVGLLNEFMPQDKVKTLLAGGRGRGYLIGSLLGGLTPFCSCSTIPVTVGLLRAGAGFGPTMAFLFTSPLVNPIIVPLFFTLLGVEVTLVYVVVAVGMTIGVSYLLQRLGFSRFVLDDVISPAGSMAAAAAPPSAAACCDGEVLNQSAAFQFQSIQECCDGPAAGGGGLKPVFPSVYQEESSRWRRVFADAVGQFRKLLPFVVLGVAIGSLIHGFLPADIVVKLAGQDNPLAVPVSAIVGIPLYLRVSTMVPIAASLVAKGMSMGAVVALIIGGAGASLPEVAMLKGIFRLPLLVAFLASVMAMAVSAGLLVNALL